MTNAMETSVESVRLPGLKDGQRFQANANEVLSNLRARVADVLSELGNFSRPADVQRALELDKTLGRQVFKLACTADALGGGSVVPSRTSMRRFLEAAKVRGTTGDSVEGVWSAYEVFEKLVETHAGDRSTFNSMVSAAGGTDDEWFAAEAQHRRNAFRAMSHTIGVQAKTEIQLAIVNESDDGACFDIAIISGLYGLHVLRQLPRVRVFGHSLGAATDTATVRPEPLGLSPEAGGQLLTPFCSQPLPTIKVSGGSNQYGQWQEVLVENPEIGKTGTNNLVFGTVYRGLPALNQPLNVSRSSHKPIEVLLLDVLKCRGNRPAAEPTGSGSLGSNDKFGAEIIPLRGRFKPERLGQGPAALATPEIPRYKDLLQAVASKLGWEIDGFDAWRMRIEFPIYRSTVTMTWDEPAPVGR